MAKPPWCACAPAPSLLNASALIPRRPFVLWQDDAEQLSSALEPFFPNATARGERVDVLLQLVIAALLQHDALRRLLAVQKLDTQDVEGAYQARFSRNKH